MLAQMEGSDGAVHGRMVPVRYARMMELLVADYFQAHNPSSNPAMCECSPCTRAWVYLADTLRERDERHADKFMSMLFRLSSHATDHGRRVGNPRTPAADLVFSLILKEYTGLSARRLSPLLSEAAGRGLLTKIPHYNTILHAAWDAALTPKLQEVLAVAQTLLGDVVSAPHGGNKELCVAIKDALNLLLVRKAVLVQRAREAIAAAYGRQAQARRRHIKKARAPRQSSGKLRTYNALNKAVSLDAMLPSGEGSLYLFVADPNAVNPLDSLLEREAADLIVRRLVNERNLSIEVARELVSQYCDV